MIYRNQCKVCNVQYVDQTKKTTGENQSHYSTIRNKLCTPLLRHLSSHDIEHEDIPVTITVLQLIRTNADTLEAISLRNKSEAYWISKLFSQVPKGLNILD